MNILKWVSIVGIAFITGCTPSGEDIGTSITKVPEPEVIASEVEYLAQTEKIAFDKMANATVTSKQESENTIPANAEFDLQFDNDVTKEYVINTFSIKPYKEIGVTEVTPKYYKLTVKNGLDEDQVYNIIERTTEGTTRWAFQTEKVFKVEYTYPENGGFVTETGTPEIRFNGKISKDTKLKDYISITPNINGEWKEMYSYNYHFEHSKHFDPKEIYEVTVKKGLKDEDGNVLKEDYTFSFAISNEEDIFAYLSVLNNYKPNNNIDLSLSLNLNLEKALSLKDAKIKIINLGSKEEFVKAIKNIESLEEVKKYYESKNYTVTFEKDIKNVIESEYNKAKSEEKYWYYEDVPLDLNLQIKEQGYYVAILDVNGTYSSSLFQVNDSTASCSTLAENNFMILYKGKGGNNNSVDVYLNNQKLGTTNEEGFLYLENFRKIASNIDKEVNYIEFYNEGTRLICDVSSQVHYMISGENPLNAYSRYNNGYIYVDRNSYKPGETVSFWGYAKNRKINVENATLKVTYNWSDELAVIPLKLSDVGTFEGEFVLDNVDKESSISFDLYIGDNLIAQRYIEVRDYELKQYNITIKPEKNEYIDGEEAVINITAETYDGTPLKNLDFEYAIGSNYYYYDKNSKKVDGKVTTDEYGMATIRVPLKLTKNSTNILSETVGVTILNTYIDGEQAREYFTVYPYKHYAIGNIKYIVDDNKYNLSFDEYLSLDKKTPANDSIKVVAKAFKTVRKVTGTRYNKYTKEMEDIVEYNQVAQTSYDKTFTVSIKNGKGEYSLDNYSTDKNSYYKFYAYLITDTGKELALTYDGQIYSYSYKTIFDDEQYEEIEYVDPIINEELTYTLVYETNNKLKVGDEVYFYLRDSEGRRLKDYSKFEFYTLVSSAEGNKIIKNKGERPHFTFTKEMGANCNTYTVCYDSLKAYSPTASYSTYYYYDYMYKNSYYRPSAEIKLCDEELSLKVDITFDKQAYEPKDVATIKIKVTDNGKGVKAGVNLSALDTAFIDANGEIDTNILSSLINNYYISSLSNDLNSNTRIASKQKGVNATMSMDSAMGLGMVEEAAIYDEEGGYNSEETRDDLKITAFFESVVTDDNGVAEIKVKMPDNITEWTIKAQAISNDFKAISEEKKIKVSKDFYVSLNFKDRYLVGENFAFNIKSFSKKYAGKDVTFDIQILDESGKVVEQGKVNAKAQDVLSYKVSKPIDTKGTYKIKITGTCSGIKDTLIDEIELVDSLLDATAREDLVLKVGDKIKIVSNKGYIYILNEDVAKILPTLFELQWMYGDDRNDLQVISSEAQRIFSNLLNGKEFEYGKKYLYDAEKTIFKVKDNASDDARLALRMLATKSISVSSEEVSDKVEVRLGENAALWAKVNMGSATLNELRNAKEDVKKNSSAYKVEDVLYLALAFADMGSTDEAIEVYNMCKSEVNDKDENQFELKIILAIKLNLKEVDDLYNSYIAKQDDMLPENYNFIKLYYVQNVLSKNFKKGEITLRVNGKDEVVEVNNVGLTRVLVNGKDDIELVAKTDNLSFMIEQYKPVDFTSISNKKYFVSKTYSNTNPKEGDMVEVSIVIDNKKLYDDGMKYGFKVEDGIPNNMTFVEYIYGKNTGGYLRKQDGQKLTINYWNPYDPKWNSSATKTTLKYKVRVTNGGEKYEPGTILVEYNNMIVDGMK